MIDVQYFVILAGRREFVILTKTSQPVYIHVSLTSFSQLLLASQRAFVL